MPVPPDASYDFGMRFYPRVAATGLCGVVTGGELRHATMVDLSTMGIRLERPFDPAKASRAVQLEIELPECDEIVWAKGHVTHAHLRPMGGLHADGQPRLWCSAGVQIDLAATRDRRMMRDFVLDANSRALAA